MNKKQVNELLSQMGVQPKKSLGQNFLIDSRIIEKIILNVSKLDSRQIVEIGPGLGALTNGLKKLEKPLTLIELDNRFSEYWRQQGFPLVHGDALKINWTELFSEPFLLVSNLPYQISASIVVEMSANVNNCINMVLMFQKEVAQRITAKPKTKEYGFLSVIAQLSWKIVKLQDVSASCFYPPPKVASRVLVFDRSPHSERVDEKFVSFLKICFAQRRKMLLKRLLKEIPMQKHSALMEYFGLKGFSVQARVEEMTPEEIFGIYEVIR